MNEENANEAVEMGTENLENAMVELKELAILIKLAFADGKIDWKDGKYGLALANKIPEYVGVFKSIEDMGLEVKDLNDSELVKIGAAFVSAVLDVKNAKEEKEE